MDEQLLATCRELVERKLGWGPSAEWVPHDFERLSSEILETTGRVVSATTLKRVWGTVKYDSSPSTHTLDTLAEFVGYTHWRVFKLEHGGIRMMPRRRRLVLGVPILVVVAALLIVGLASRGGSDGSDMSIARIAASATAVPGSETASFSSRPVAIGLPNTVVFDYDVSGVTADSFFIQQSWDERLRSQIDRDGSAFTSLYYYPGHFQAKLIANNTVIREHPLHVTTDGWLALVEADPVPLYIPAKSVSTDGALQANRAWLANNDVDLASSDLRISYYQVRDFGDIDGDNFRLETAIRLDDVGAQAACRHSTLIVMAEHAKTFIPMSIPGCVSDLYAQFSDVELPGGENDLSALGRDLSRWQPLLLDVRDKHVTLKIGDTVAIDTTYQSGAGRIVGLRYRFQGAGEVKYVRLFDQAGASVYVDEFERSDQFTTNRADRTSVPPESS